MDNLFTIQPLINNINVCNGDRPEAFAFTEDGIVQYGSNGRNKSSRLAGGIEGTCSLYNP